MVTKLRSKISARLPKSVLPLVRRLDRRVMQAVRGLAARNRPGVVVMLHVGRCGSTVLANLLEQDPEIYWDGKLHRKGKMLYGDRLKGMDHKTWLGRQFTLSGARHYGFEFKILQDQYPAMAGLDLDTVLADCQALGVTHYILLVRRNTLRHVISHYASVNRGSWHFSKGDNIQQQQFELDLDAVTTGSAPGRSLTDYLSEVELAHDTVRQRLEGQRLLEISYEDDIDAQGAQFAYEKISRFLGTRPVEVVIRNRKANPFPMSSTLLNYDSLSQRLQGTEFEWMLE